MSYEKTAIIAKKAMAYDLIELFEVKPENENYTREEVKTIINDYIDGVMRNWGLKACE
jgi:hypothetical protein